MIVTSKNVDIYKKLLVNLANIYVTIDYTRSGQFSIVVATEAVQVLATMLLLELVFNI